MNQSQQLLSCFLTITPLCSDQVTLLPHQRRALAWLLWRETQNPCGGILGKSTEQFGSLLQRNSILWGTSGLFFLLKFHKLPWFSCLNAADDMGLGKTLTMISLILTQKYDKRGEDEKKEKKLDKWLSKTGNCSIISPLFLDKTDKGNPTSKALIYHSDSTLVASKATLIICPASLIHHWKREIDRHVRSSKLSVYLYHGPNREKSARA